MVSMLSTTSEHESRHGVEKIGEKKRARMEPI